MRQSGLVIAFLLSTMTAPAAADPSKAQITVLYDAFGKASDMQKDWGYAALIEYGGKRILFDTGNNPDILAQNAKAKRIDLSKLDFVVMSHRHGDHMGGMAYLLSVNPKVKMYAPKEGFGIYGAQLPSAFYRKDASLPPEQRYYEGKPPEVMRFGSAWPDATFELIDQNTEIAPGIHLIALVSDKPGTLELRELSLAQYARRYGRRGRVLASRHRQDRGRCGDDQPAHPSCCRRVSPGGVQGRRDREDGFGSARYVQGSLRRPGHCTGEPTFAALRKAFGVRYLYAGLGTTLALDAMPRPIAGAGPAVATAMDEDDLDNYRALREKSHDDAPTLVAQDSR